MKIPNVIRDLNIALINKLIMIFEQMNYEYRDIQEMLSASA
ncbi:hypothetical protein CLERM_100 [Coxiella-like endosymbiont]|nr:hypothetical protein CLERM_100 [Coxiella-like endosymbiont]